MLVRERMTTDPVTVTPKTSVPEAMELLTKHGFRRLPVVDGGRLVGIATEMDLKKAMPSVATSLSVWELLYLLPKVTVGEMMSRDVRTVAPDDPLARAAVLMERHKIGGLPVVEGGRLVGIVTITDVLGALIELLELEEGGTGDA